MIKLGWLAWAGAMLLLIGAGPFGNGLAALLSAVALLLTGVLAFVEGGRA